MSERIGPNLRLVEVAPTVNKPKPYTLFFISALGGADHGIKPIKYALETIEIGNEVDTVVWNSVLSSDPPTPKRWNKMAEQIEQIRDNGRKIVFIVHSGGAAELAKTFDKIKKDRPELLSTDELSNVEVILIGPAGILSGNETRRRTKRLLASQLGLPRVEKHTTTTAGLESLYIFPPRRQDETQVNLSVREVFPELSNIYESVPLIPSDPDNQYWKLVSDEIKEEVETIDSNLFSALNRAGSKKEAEELLKRRARLLNEAGIKAYDAVDPEKQADWKPKKISKMKNLRLLPLFRKMLFKGVKNDFKKLEDKGLRVHWIVPEYDTFVLLKDLQEVYTLPIDQLVEKINIVVLERSTHASWAPLPKQLGDAVLQILSS